MRLLNNAEMLHVWEAGLQQNVLERSLQLLGFLYNTDAETTGKLSIGQRDTRLLSFREWMFGTRLMNVAQCPKCGAKIEWETDTRDIRLQQVELAAEVKVFQVQENGYTIDFRLPNSLDLLQTFQEGAKERGPEQLLSRCILHAHHAEKGNLNELPEYLMEKLETKMGEADPQAEITMLLSCPECGHQWPSTFDIMRYLWLEIDDWAKKLIYEVATIARAFGWSEKDILNMGYQRRKMYLNLLQG